jgi:uncharacterized membrane protein YjjP (DUF1212 family)
MKKRERKGSIFAFGVYFFASILIGMLTLSVSVDNLFDSIPLPFIFFHIVIFLGIFLFKSKILPAKQPLVPLFLGAVLYLLQNLPHLEWLNGWVGGLDLFLFLLGVFLCILH